MPPKDRQVPLANWRPPEKPLPVEVAQLPPASHRARRSQTLPPPTAGAEVLTRARAAWAAAAAAAAWRAASWAFTPSTKSVKAWCCSGVQNVATRSSFWAGGSEST